MRNVAILVDGSFYLKQYPKFFGTITDATDAKRVVQDLQSHCLRHVYAPRVDQLPAHHREHHRELERLYRIFFYDCPPIQKKARHPITNAPIDFERTSTAIFRVGLHAQLKQTRNLALRLGALDERNARWKIKDPKVEKALITGQITHRDLRENDIIYSARQKSVDMKLGLDIAALSYKKIVNKVVLISGDSDFVSAAKLARREGIEFVLDPMYAPIKVDLQEHIDGLHTTLPAAKKRFHER